ncbi:hypothetical protein CHS0354_017249 [Potamilus streckersoni]|uniref:Uncharacterized protein n=1 Tax=Potamilus streckersoni TaxID=2493646 RepID=A0AAE0RYX3_9BIVA|nr:hypothetical protein CHS0354_017249 [Potamilus streckersoni]
MAKLKCRSDSHFVCFMLFLIILAAIDVEAARGGGVRSGGVRVRTRISSGSSISSSGGFMSRYRGPSYSRSNWRTGFALGYVWGASHYMTRRRYISNPDREPTVCFNANNLKNDTYGYFVCPMEDEPDSYEYCCGEEGDQNCCGFFDDPGRAAGTIIGIIVFCALVALVIYCCCKRKQIKKKIGGSIFRKKEKHESVPLRDPTYEYSGSTQPTQMSSFPTSTPYYPQPGATESQQSAPSGASYDHGAPGDLPYSVNPAGGTRAVPMPSHGAVPIGFYGQQGIYPGPDGAKPPLPQEDVSMGNPVYPPTSATYPTPQGIGFSYSDPSAPPYGLAPPHGQEGPYPLAPPPAYSELK